MKQQKTDKAAGPFLHRDGAAGRAHRPALIGRLVLLSAILALVVTIRVIHATPTMTDAVAADTSSISTQTLPPGGAQEGGLHHD